MTQIESGDVCLLNLYVVERAEVENRQCRGDLVNLKSSHVEINRTHCHRLGTEAAAEVCDLGNAGTAKATGVKRSRLQPRGLLEAVFCEEHAVGEIAKLLASSAAKLGLAKHGGNQPGVIALGSQRTDQFENVCLGIEVADRAEQG